MLRGRQTDVKLVADRTVGVCLCLTLTQIFATLVALRRLAQPLRRCAPIWDCCRICATILRAACLRRVWCGGFRSFRRCWPALRSLSALSNHGAAIFPVTRGTVSRRSGRSADPRRHRLRRRRVTNSVGITGRPIVFRVWGPVIAEYPANPAFSYRAIAEAWKRDQRLGPPLTWTRPHVRQDLRFVPLLSVTVGTIVSDWPQDSMGAEPARPAPQRNREVRASGGGTRTVVRSDIARRPPRAEKERKVRVALGASSIPGQIIAAMTEGIDMVQAFFGALTDEQRAQFITNAQVTPSCPAWIGRRSVVSLPRQSG